MKNIKMTPKICVFMLSVLAVGGLGGCASTATDPRDPWESWNRGVMSVNDALDDYLMKPIARGYRWIMPDFLDTGVTNFFSNVGDIGVTVNDLLQAKFKQSGSDATRLLINTTVGLAGFFDVATGWGFEKHDEDTGQSFGAWGIPTGPYLVLPFLGPSNPRDAIGFVGDAAMNPINYLNDDGIRWGINGLQMVDFRADNLSTSKIAEEASLDRYEFIRNAYLQRREYVVYDGNPPMEDEEEFDDFDIDADFEAEMGAETESVEVESEEGQEVEYPASDVGVEVDGGVHYPATFN